MYLVNLDLNFSSFPSHITTLYRGGGEIAYRDKKHSVPRVLAVIVFFVYLNVTDIEISQMAILG